MLIYETNIFTNKYKLWKFSGENNLTFINLNSSIHITCTNIESICFPGLLKNLEGKHNNNYIVK